MPSNTLSPDFDSKLQGLINDMYEGRLKYSEYLDKFHQLVINSIDPKGNSSTREDCPLVP